MNAEDPWKPFRKVMEEPWEQARLWKKSSGGKVIGHLLPDVPEEILHAAGAFSVALEGAGASASHAQAHMPSYTCNHAMGAVEMGLRGELDVLDGMVIPYVCDTTRNLSHLWARLFPHIPCELLRMPKRIDFPGSRDYLRAEFARLIESAGKITGQSPGSDDLAQSITLYNRSRARLREAYRKHREQPTVWTADNVRIVLGSSLRARREDHLKWMDALPWEESSPGSDDRIPIYLRGKVWDPPGIANLIDELHLLVVRDDLVTGYRAIEKDAPLDSDPVTALVERHISTVPYTGYHAEPRSLAQAFVNRVRESRAKGVVFLNPKFCEAAAFDTPDFQKALEKENIPGLILETSARGIALEQLKTRLEAFREMIAGDLP